MKKGPLIFVMIAITLAFAACAGPPSIATPEASELTPVTLMLDWVPNTNHTGIFVAAAQGFFEDAGLEVQIIQPGEVYAEQAVTSGAADFGVSFQEQITLARADSIPIVSIAAIIQHNTSGFAARGELGVDSPADWEGLTYGSFGSPFEEPTLQVLMDCDGGDYEKLNVVETGFADPLALLDEAQTDLAWIFYAWQGVQAQQQGIDLDIIMMADWFDCIPDYYTPVFIASEQTIQTRPAIVRAFLEAISRGYSFAIANPDEAASILLESVPELDAELVRASQAWLSTRYQADAVRWGEQELSTWIDYTEWMVINDILDDPIDAHSAFTNEFLP